MLSASHSPWPACSPSDAACSRKERRRASASTRRGTRRTATAPSRSRRRTGRSWHPRAARRTWFRATRTGSRTSSSTTGRPASPISKAPTLPASRRPGAASLPRSPRTDSRSVSTAMRATSTPTASAIPGASTSTSAASRPHLAAESRHRNDDHARSRQFLREPDRRPALRRLPACRYPDELGRRTRAPSRAHDSDHFCRRLRFLLRRHPIRCDALRHDRRPAGDRSGSGRREGRLVHAGARTGDRPLSSGPA
jgi:hypothetical protein